MTKNSGRRQYIIMEEKRGNILYLVVPCYNEEEIIERSIAKLKEKVNRLIKEEKVSPKSKIMFVNDGSRDRTLSLLHAAAKEDSMISVLGFPSDVVYFDVKEREAGTSKYTLKKMMTLAKRGIPGQLCRKKWEKNSTIREPMNFTCLQIDG